LFFCCTTVTTKKNNNQDLRGFSSRQTEIRGGHKLLKRRETREFLPKKQPTFPFFFLSFEPFLRLLPVFEPFFHKTKRHSQLLLVVFFPPQQEKTAHHLRNPQLLFVVVCFFVDSSLYLLFFAFFAFANTFFFSFFVLSLQSTICPFVVCDESEFFFCFLSLFCVPSKQTTTRRFVVALRCLLIFQHIFFGVRFLFRPCIQRLTIHRRHWSSRPRCRKENLHKQPTKQQTHFFCFGLLFLNSNLYQKKHLGESSIIYHFLFVFFPVCSPLCFSFLFSIELKGTTANKKMDFLSIFSFFSFLLRVFVRKPRVGLGSQYSINTFFCHHIHPFLGGTRN